ncbi:hypothetical protein [Photobacterium sp.]|uniref:hypothetical protein n=1 Tax=Photobacterium sp. TaxID=660 RepID=UPI00299E6A11|nr:hypothetical protein [Photobacterium sp.]MDX1301022.1 hypothetical protein [Photobacterium sp.]
MNFGYMIYQEKTGYTDGVYNDLNTAKNILEHFKEKDPSGNYFLVLVFDGDLSSDYQHKLKDLP